MDDTPVAKKSSKKVSSKKNAKKKTGRKKVTNKKTSSNQTSEASVQKVYFRENTANATTAGEKKIAEIADELTVDTKAVVKITGYASSSEPEPQALAANRANYIADKFVEQYSIDASRIDTETSVSDVPQSMATIDITRGEEQQQ